jgi:hypothetical protein
MTYQEFMELVICDGVEAATEDYSKPEDRRRLEGALKGFEECRGRSPKELAGLLEEATRTVLDKHLEEAGDYWYWRCRECEIEWVCNVLGAAVYCQIGGAMVTARGVLKAAEVKAKGDGCLAV